MLDFMQDWPAGSVLLLIVFIALGPAAAGIALGRRLRPMAELRREHDVVGFTFNVVGVIYAVMLGFVLTNIWGQYEHTDEVATLEGISLRNLHRNSYALPMTNQLAIRTALLAYTHAVVEDEWPALRRRHDSTLAQDAMQRVWQSYYAVQPTTAAQKLWLAESINTLNEIAKLRRVRILAAEQTVSWVLWIWLLTGGVMTCSFMYAFGVERYRSHLLMTASVTVLILMILYIIYALDNPFWGEPHITPDAFIRFLQVHPTPE